MAVTHPRTDRAPCKATALIKTNTLPLHETATSAAMLLPKVITHADILDFKSLPGLATGSAVAKRGRVPPASPAKTECPPATFRTVGLTHSDPVGE